jgi:hypothetical protein
MELPDIFTIKRAPGRLLSVNMVINITGAIAMGD